MQSKYSGCDTKRRSTEGDQWICDEEEFNAGAGHDLDRFVELWAAQVSFVWSFDYYDNLNI